MLENLFYFIFRILFLAAIVVAWRKIRRPIVAKAHEPFGNPGPGPDQASRFSGVLVRKDINLWKIGLKNMEALEDVLVDVLCRLPAEARSAYFHSGYRVIVVADNLWPQVLQSRGIGLNPAEYGGFSYKERAEVLFKASAFQPKLIAHELGHVVQYLVGPKGEGPSKVFFQQHASKIAEIAGWDYPKQSPEECWAETFALFATQRQQLLNACPKAANLVAFMMITLIEKGYAEAA